MNPIYWLTTTKQYKHLSNHFILKLEKKFMVFTTNPQPFKECKTHFISQTNITGANQPQYLVDKIHVFDPQNMISIPYQKGFEYFKLHQMELQPFIEKIIEKLQ